MRVTGGKYLRRNLSCPPGIIRPSMDRMRESVFSCLGTLDGESFLDLFSGSGIIAVEAASRGAKSIALVEGDRGKKATIEKNLSFVEEDKRLFIRDVFSFIQTTSLKWDNIFADPPFDMGNKTRILSIISERGLLNPKGLFMIHFPAEERKEWPLRAKDIALIDERKYGRSLVLFYKEDSKEK